MLDYPLPACAGNVDTDLWDDAGALIERKLEFRGGAPGGVKPWPEHLFFVGDGMSVSCHAIDLRSPDTAVWWVDHGHVDLGDSGEIEASFSKWAEPYLRDLREDLEADGVDPDASPQVRDRVEATYATERFLSLGVLIVVVTALLIGFAIFVEITR